jgi:effector-binding domain-containing protein
MFRPITALRSLALVVMAFAATACLAVALILSPGAAQAQAQASPQASPQTAPPVDNSNDGSSPITVELKGRPAVALAGSADWDDGMHAIADAIDRLRVEMSKAGLEPAGNPLAVFVETDDKGFRYEAMIPLASQPETAPVLSNGVRIATSPAGKTMKFEHRGSYDEIDTTYEAITAYLDEKGLEAQNLFVEEYLNLPKTSEDEGAQVDIYVFLK